MERAPKPPRRALDGLVGRSHEIGIAERALAAADQPAVLYLHGPGGIGKTAIARELAARARQQGRPVWSIDGREVPPRAEALEEALEGVEDDREPPLIALDSFELIAASAAHLRDELIPSLPAGAAVVIASRNPPDQGWLELSRGARFTELRIGPIATADAVRLAAAAGLDERRAEAVAEWAQGHPLAIQLGARTAVDDPSWVPGSGLAPDELVRALVRQLGEADVAAGHYPALAVAALARSTTPALLAAALPEHDAEAEWVWLSARGFAEAVGEGVALHALLREAVRAEMNRRDPTLEAVLRKRIADHVYEVASDSGELSKVLDLSHLIEHLGLRWFVWEVSSTYFLDSPRPGDADRIDRLLADPDVEPIGGGESWTLHRPFFERMPELGAVVKDAAGEIRGFTVVATTAVDDAELEASPVVGPCLRHARALEPRGEAVIMPFMCDLTGDPLSGIIGMLANAALLRASRSNPRYTYMTIGEEVEFGQRFAEYAGAERLPELDIELGDTRLLCWLLDYGAGGFLAHQRELVYRELGLDPPPRPAERIESVRAEQVRDALRNLGSPVELARSPLARGEGVEERARSVRELLGEATAQAFGEDPIDRLLRETLRRGYLEPAGTHELAAQQVHLSRSAYFRRLSQAVDRLAKYLGAGS